MPKSLFTEIEQYSEDGCSFADEATEVIRPLLAKWASKGFTGHEMLVILFSVANLERSLLQIRRVLEARVTQRSKRSPKPPKERKPPKKPKKRKPPKPRQPPKKPKKHRKVPGGEQPRCKP